MHMHRDPSGIRSATLHHIGTQTGYRLSEKTPHTGVHAGVASLLREDYCKGAPPALRPFLMEMESLEAPTSEGDLDQVLGTLAQEGLIRSVRESWALTLEGLPEAVEYHARFDPTRNITTAWFCRNLTPAMLDRMIFHIGRKCPKSAAVREEKDLVDTYLEKFMVRDGLRKYLIQGKNITQSSIQMWAHRSALTQFRDRGRDALTRTTMGARTERDLAGDPVAVFSTGGDAPTALYLVEGAEGEDLSPNGGSGGSAPLMDVADMEADTSASASMNEVLDKLKHALRKRKGANPEKFANLLSFMVGGDSPPEEGKKHASTLLSELRTAVGDILRTGSNVCSVLSYVDAEPYATPADIEADVPGSHRMLVSRIAAAGWMREEKGSYVVSPRGKALLRERADGDTLMTAVAIFDQI